MATSPLVATAEASGGALGADARSAARRLPLAALAVLALTAVGAVPRVLVAHQPVFADELSTYWISVRHSLGGVLSLLYSSGRIHHAEITPPLSFLASWLTTRAGATVELLRLPSLLAGIATIPLVHLLGLRTVGRRAALTAAALTALSPFMIYYSAEARAYGLMMLLVVCAVLCLVLAIDTGRRRWWALYAVCAAAAFYSHYTSVFVLAVALGWTLWSEPRARRAALLANAGAAALVIPWIPGLIQDIRSPTVKILSELSAFTPGAVRVDLEHWALGYPYTVAGGLRALPGVAALVLLALAAAVALVGLARRRPPARWRTAPWPTTRRPGAPTQRPTAPTRRLVLVGALMLATPVGEIVASAVGNHIIGVRDLAASWPFLALTAAAALAGAGRRLGLVAAALAVVAFGLGAEKMLQPRFARPNFQAAADYVAARARPGDVVIDATGPLSPGPLTGLDVALHRRLTVLRVLAPAERDHPFGLFDQPVPISRAFAQAVTAARGGRVFIVSVRLPVATRGPDITPPVLPGGYRLRAQRSWRGFVLTLASVYSR